MDIATIRRLVRRWAWLVVALAVIAGGTAAAVSYELPRTYQSQAVALVNPKQLTPSANPNGSFDFSYLGVDGLIATYVRLIDAGPVQQKLAEQGLPSTSSITAAAEKGTSLIDVTVTDSNPQVAYQVALKVIPAFNSALDELQAKVLGPNSTGRLDALVPWQLPAGPSSSPVSPTPARNILIGLVAGALLGAALAALLEFFDKSVKSEYDVRLKLDLPLLGPVLFKGRRFGRSRREEVALVTITHPTDPVSEAYRGIRTNLMFNAVDRPLRTLVVTSAVPGEGKTSTACNLAVAMAQAGNRVILVDADFRRPEIHRVFGRRENRGLGNLILGDAPEEELILNTQVPNLRVVASGASPPNPSELLGSARMKKVTERLMELSDVIIFDTPPVGAVTDATVLGARSDGVILVVERGRADVQSILRAKERLEAVGANLLGVVLNKVRQSEAAQYYYYQYYTLPVKAQGRASSRNGRPARAPVATGGMHLREDSASLAAITDRAELAMGTVRAPASLPSAAEAPRVVKSPAPPESPAAVPVPPAFSPPPPATPHALPPAPSPGGPVAAFPPISDKEVS